MNGYIAAAWALTCIFAYAALVALIAAIAAYVDLIHVDAVVAFALAISFAGYTLAPLGYARARSR